jgi:hypothetical protein
VTVGAAAQENNSEEADTTMGNANDFLPVANSASPGSSTQLVDDVLALTGSDEAGDLLSPTSAASSPDEDEDYAKFFMHVR